MSSTDTITAVNGKVEISPADAGAWVEIPEVRSASLNLVKDRKAYASSSTGGRRRRKAAIGDCNGTIEVYLDTTDEFWDNWREGDEVDIRIYIDGTSFWEVQAILGDLVTNVNIEEGDLIPGTLPFEGNGTVTPPA